jgi:hypothetical protein
MWTVIVSISLVVVFIGGWFLAAKFGAKNPVAVSNAFDMAALLSSVAASLIKNTEAKTDPHDVLAVIAKVASTGSSVVKQATSGGDVGMYNDQMKKFVMDVVSQFPELSSNLTEADVDKEIAVALLSLSTIAKK